MSKSKLDLPEKTRSAVIRILQARLADTIDLLMQTKQAHWNVKGPQFISLHELFDSIFENVVDWMDLLGERIVQLGGRADSAISNASQKTTLPDYPLNITRGADHLENLSNSLAQYAAAVRQAINLCTDAGDAATADIFTEISRAADMNLWLVEAHAGGDESSDESTALNRVPKELLPKPISGTLKKGDRAHSAARANRNDSTT
jgi:starvation-inducible DNA-binding protein